MTATRQSLMRAASIRLAEAGCDTPQLDAEILLAHVLGMERTSLFLDLQADVPAGAVDRFHALVARRETREPVARIVGYRDFWNHKFDLNEDTLVPRPDSETLVEAALGVMGEMTAPKVVDFGTGTGCLLLSLLDEVGTATGLGLDISSRALEAAASNAKRVGVADRVELCAYNWNRDGLPVEEGSVDVVISNPPYIADSDKPSLAPDVLNYDPARALFADDGGFADYTTLAPIAYAILRKGGHVFFEVGKGQAKKLADGLADLGFAHITSYNDLAGVPRVVHGIKR